MATPVAVAAGTTDVAVVGARRDLKLRGYSIAETASSAAAAEAIIRHGTSNSDPQLIAPINLDANGHGMFWFDGHGVDCPEGIWFERVNGNISLVVYVDPLEATL